MATYRTFEEMEIWQKARTFAKNIYSLTTEGSFSKDFALRDQISRSTGSIMDNIAEGFERGNTKEFILFLSYAKGSAGEARSQLCRAFDREHIAEYAFKSLTTEALDVSKGRSGFITYLKGSSFKGPRFHEPELNYGEIPADFESDRSISNDMLSYSEKPDRARNFES